MPQIKLSTIQEMRKIRVVLINAPIDLGRVLGSGSVFADPGEPSGIMYIASYLREHNANVEVSIIDSFQHNYTVDMTYEKLLSIQPDIVGISCVTANGGDAFRLGKKIKDGMKNTLVIMGNTHPAFFKEIYLNNNACDIVVHGEGELTTSEIVERFRSGSDNYEDIQGIFYKRGTEIVENPSRDFVDVSSLPFPARDLIDISAYAAYKEGVCIIHGSRGCTFRCNFCSLHERRYRYRSADNIIAEIIHCKETYGFKYFIFFDPLFGGNNKQSNEFCEKMIALGLNKEVRWSCEVHVNLIREDKLRLWKEAGLHSVAFGIESGNDEILKIANKNEKIETVRNAVQIAHDLRLMVIGLFIIGLPGDTEKTIAETIQFAKTLPLTQAQFSTFTPYPGSQFYKDLVAKGHFDHIDFNNIDEILHWWEQFSAYTAFTDNKFPIYTPEGISPERLKQLQRKAFRDFYLSSPSRILHRAKLVGFKNSLRHIRPALRLFGRNPMRPEVA